MLVIGSLPFSFIKMAYFSLLLLCSIYFLSEAGVTEIPSHTSDEVTVETVSGNSWMPSNIFDVQVKKAEIKEIQKQSEDSLWDEESNSFFQVIRDLIFQAGDELIEADKVNIDPTEEIVKIIEKGLIEATTMFLAPSEELPDPSTDPAPDPISVLKIENDASDNILDRIGLNIVDFQNKRETSVSIANTTTACSNCYNTLEICVQQCFEQHNCHDVQRQVRICPPPSARLCNIFSQWGPVDECKTHEDCKSPLLCCSDGCVNKCSPGIWRN